MKKTLLVLMLLGTMTVEAEPKYRIETWVQNNQRYFKPQRKVWFKTNHFTLPFKVWVSTDYPYQNKWQAEEIIENKNIKHSEYIKID